MPNKTDRAERFRQSLSAAMALKGMTQSALARATGADRSTISALLAPGTRLPGAGLAADCAQALGVSLDWLLGLQDQPQPADQLLATMMQMTDAPRALFDAEIFRWHQEAAGYKIRHVPATLPDLLKTESVVRWEYQFTLGGSADQAVAAFQDQLDWLRGARSDYEIALPLHELQSFAEGTGYWSGLDLGLRAAQLDHLIALCEAHYPALRLYLFDARRVFSAPVTLFGPLRAVIYLGRSYLCFEDPARVAALSQHFDWLLRAAPFGARETLVYLKGLRQGAV